LVPASIPYVEGLQLQQLGVLEAFLFAAAVHALMKETFVVAGLLLACATIKPQLSVYFIGFVLLWCMGQWGSRKRIAISFLSALTVLVLASEVLLPRWPFEFLAGIPPYLLYTQATTAIHELFGPLGARIVVLVLAVVIVLSAWRAKSEPADSDEFRLALSLILVFTCIVIPSLAPHNQVLLVPACLLLVKERRRIWAGGRIARSLWCATWLAIAWPWVVGSFLAMILLLNRTGSQRWDLPLATNPLIPILVFAALVPLLVRASGIERSVLVGETPGKGLSPFAPKPFAVAEIGHLH
jgi:hypothetical protein